MGGDEGGEWYDDGRSVTMSHDNSKTVRDKAIILQVLYIEKLIQRFL